MGSNQLLLILFGTIVIGIAIIIGINLASTTAEQSNRDALLSDLTQLTARAKAHFLKPKVLGGGGHSFANFTIPEDLAETANGTLEHYNESHGTDHIHFRAIGNSIGENGKDPINIEVRLEVDELKIKVKN